MAHSSTSKILQWFTEGIFPNSSFIFTTTTNKILPKQSGVLHGSVVKYLTCNPSVMVQGTLDPLGFHGSVLGQDTSKPQPSTSETQERHG